MEVAIEDDVFFADLSKQISLLIMDDEEDLVNPSPPASYEGIARPMYQSPRTPYLQEQQFHARECKGTGVFIPRSSHTRRKSKQEGCNSSNNAKFNKQFDNSRGFSPQVPSHNSKASYNESFNPRRIQ